MGLLDNDTVIVDAILTKAGRRKLAEGKPLGITQFAFGDTGVDYTLYNPNHPDGSSAYGTAITSLPQMEAVPHELVFMRSKLYGTGQRNVQNYTYVHLQNITETISKTNTVGNEGFTSQPISITPTVVPISETSIGFTFRILDARGLIINDDDTTANPFSSPDVQPVQVSGEQLVLNARAGEITAQKVIGVEVRRDGAAPAFLTVTIESNTSN
tara:strand:+ start:18153 stop:18791 length:639 start_codon:yes stop_codon:yes gene_type:complete